jgi:hypothetical protein
MDGFDTDRIAVRGATHNLVSNNLLKAAHILICRYCFGETESMPTPTEVRALAEELQQNESQ